MGELVLTRVDERLIHGVICVTWAPNVNANKIIAVDDITASDDFLSSIMKSCATNVEADILSVDQAVAAWKDNQFGDGRILLIFKYIKDAIAAYEKGLEFSPLQLGWITSSAGRERINQALNLSADEVALLRKLEKDHGVPVKVQYSPQFESISLKEALKGKFKETKGGE